MAAAAIRVSVSFADSTLAERIIALLATDRGFDLIFDDDRAADVVITDHLSAASGPAILVTDGVSDQGLIDADVRAILPPDVDSELLRAVIRVVSAGLAIREADEPRAERVDDNEIALTAREGEVLQLLAHGASNKSIARDLGISVHTAKFHVASLLAKLGARNRSDAIAIGLRRGLILI
jgi:DNA-binding NarL/FixJ family response regulator